MPGAKSESKKLRRPPAGAVNTSTPHDIWTDFVDVTAQIIFSCDTGAIRHFIAGET